MGEEQCTKGRSEEAIYQKIYQQIEKLLIAFYHRDNESSNDIFSL